MVSSTSDEEEWRPVVGWEGLYEVSSLGRVRSLDRVETVTARGKSWHRLRRGKMLRQGYSGRRRQYATVVLISTAIPRANYLVHRLVLEAFIGLAPPGSEGSHLSGDAADNRTSNLAWESHAVNMARQFDHQTAAFGERNGNHRLTSADVAAIRLLKGVEGSRTVAVRFGCGATTVKEIWRGERRRFD